MSSRNGHVPSKQIRCAIYTRKSSEEGLEQDFNSLNAQRESAESYVTSMKHEGWICLSDRYDDGVFTRAATWSVRRCVGLPPSPLSPTPCSTPTDPAVADR